jgi:RNA polymerase sigma factor (sigma-70 family)
MLLTSTKSGEKSRTLPAVETGDPRLKKLKDVFRTELTKTHNTLYSSRDKKIGIFCAFSKGRPWGKSKIEYWFALHLHQKNFLEQFKDQYLVFICGGQAVVSIPFDKFLKDMSRFEGDKLHIHILKTSDNKYVLSPAGVEITSYAKSLAKKKLDISGLNPEGETDFLYFYQRNYREIDHIIQAQAGRFIDYNDFNDLRQDIIMRLNRCNVLAQFNPSRGVAFNTYLTNYIHGAVLHWLDRCGRNHRWKPWPTQTQYVESGNGQLHFKQWRYKSMNSLSEGEGLEDIPEDVMMVDPIEENLSAKELVRMIRRALPPDLLKVFNLKFHGLTNQEIANTFGSSITMISKSISKIKLIGLDYLR